MKDWSPVGLIKFATAGSLLLLTTACATPNVKPFAEQTTHLASAVAVEQKQISGKFDELIELSDDEAKKFGALAGVPGIAISEAAASALRQVAAVATRVQAQDSLAEATREVQPAVDAVAEAVEKIYEDAQKGLVTALKSDEIALLTKRAGNNTIGLYEDITKRRDDFYNGLRLRLVPYTPEKGFCIKPDASLDPSCMAAKDIQTVLALNNVMEKLEPAYVAYDRQRKDVIRWRIAVW